MEVHTNHAHCGYGQTFMQYQLQITWPNNHFILTESLNELTYRIQWSIQVLSMREVGKYWKMEFIDNELRD